MEQVMKVEKMDGYSEQIVKRKMSATKVTALVLSLMMIVLIIVLSVYLSGFFNWLVPIALLCLGLGIYLIYVMFKNAGVEYEYTFVLGEMRIDKIKGKSKRKKITVFDVKAIDDIGKYIDSKTGEKAINKSKQELVLYAAEDDVKEDTYYMLIHDKIRQKHALLLFTPNERTLSMIQPYLSVELKKKFIKMKREQENAKKQAETSVKDDTKKDE